MKMNSKPLSAGLFPAVLLAAILILVYFLTIGSCSTGQPEDGTPNPGPVELGQYTVLAWNDLGMHCLNPSFRQLMILPPYNTLWAQVVKRGNPPQLVTGGLTVEYRIEGNTFSYGKGEYGSFWDDAAPKIATPPPARDTGLTGNGLAGIFEASGDHFIAEGIPVTPIMDSGSWNPYQTAVITVKDSEGRVLAETKATVPVSDEMNCAKCHGSDSQGTFENILALHDAEYPTGSRPVVCASCHADPILGTPGTAGTPSLSLAIHLKHSQQTPEPACLDCHPGEVTQCSRSSEHTAPDGNCTTCHGTLDQVAASLQQGRQPWLEEPSCVSCHSDVAGVATGAALYRNAAGHGGLACASCHGSPHAMLPTEQVPGYPNSDAYQVLQYQGYRDNVKTLGSCGVCHRNSRGDPEIEEFSEVHGGLNPEQPIGCSACHTAVPPDTASWPHAFQWHNSNG